MSAAAFNSTSARYRTFCSTNEDPCPIHDSHRIDRIPGSHNNGMNSTNQALTTRSDSRLQCCCGKPDCAYLEHNNVALGSIEKDLEKAARLGQALLSRHESYISESQVEHARLSLQVTDLEADRNSLQDANEKIVAENRELLARLETLNNAYVDSNSQVKNLENLLHDCEVEVKRLYNLAHRVQDLEVQVYELDRQKDTLTRKLEFEEQETRSTMTRWRESERRLQEIEMEIQKIEWEAKQEREKHREVVYRLEQEHSKKEKSFRDKKESVGTAPVVSHFVRDILQDNATLQAGIAELRELLQTSNEEVQNLREQILQHQPIESIDQDGESTTLASMSDHFERNQSSPPKLSQEVHVHHHYHAKVAARRERNATLRRGSRRKGAVGHSMLSSTPELSTPSTPPTKLHRFQPSSEHNAIVNQPNAKKNRWSLQSAMTMSSTYSSLPSSPRSFFDRNGSIFDSLEAGDDSSRPTSPESMAGFETPAWGGRVIQKGLRPELKLDTFEEVLEIENGHHEDTAFNTPSANLGLGFEKMSRTRDSFDGPSSPSRDLTPKPSQILQPSENSQSQQSDPRPPDMHESPTTPKVITENEQQEVKTPTLRPTQDALPIDNTAFHMDMLPVRSSLRRTGSHESLVSISGMDIHIHSNVSQRAVLGAGNTPFNLLRGNAAHFARPPNSARKVSTSAAPAMATVTEFTAVPTSILPISQYSGISTPHRRKSMSREALSEIATIRANQSALTPQTLSSASASLTGLLGGWVRGKWGVAPVKSQPATPDSISKLQARLQSQSQSSPSQSQPPPTPSRTATEPLPSTSTITSPTTIPPQLTRPPIKKTSISSASSDSTLTLTPTTTPLPSNSLGTSFIFGSRPPGINQKGAIPGFFTQLNKPSSEVHPKVIDEEGLMEVLAE